ncbi:MAG: PDZ domain-containing protein, partial [Oscillospiraceae bacterium]|nr:PDZ domain-containing protein [Oscillospiraceae bacterium]
LGIEAVTVSKSAASYYNMVQGVYINRITEGSCAEVCGLKVGDIIISIDDTETLTMSDLIAAKKNYSAGDSAVIRVNRSGVEMDFTVIFDEEIPSEGDTQNRQSQQNQQSENRGNSFGNGGSYGYGYGNLFP